MLLQIRSNLRFLFFFLFSMSVSTLSRAQPIILTIGDSLTFGLGIPPEQTWPALLEVKLRSDGFPAAKVINAGASGATSSFGPSALKFHFKRGKPNLVVYALGANDGLRGIDPKTTALNINRSIEMIKAEGVKILLLGMKAPPNYGEKFPKDFESSFTKAAARYQLQFVPFFLEGVAGHSALNLADGLHPNAQGYAKILSNIYPKLKTLL